MAIYEVKSFRGGISDYEDKGIPGAFQFGSNLDIRKTRDSLSCGQALIDEGVTPQSASASISPSSSRSPSASISPSPSLSVSPSSSASPSPPSPSASISPSGSRSPSASHSPSASVSPSSSRSTSASPSAGSKTVFQDLILFFVNASDGFTYGFGRAGKIYKRRTSDAAWSQVFDLGKPIRGAAEKTSSGGKKYLLFASKTELHRKEIPGKNDWNDVNAAGTVQGDTWPKTNLTEADWHTMGAVGGDILIANGSMVAMSAYDDSYTNEALDLIPGNIAKTLLERNGRAVIGTYRQSNPTKGINGAVDAEVPLVQVGDDGDIFFANFIDSVPAKRLPGGGHVNPGGMINEVSQINIFDWEQTALSWIDKQSVGNMALLGVFGATNGYNGIYTYGRRRKDHPFVLNCEYQFDCDEIGAVCVVNGTIIFSYQSGSIYGVMAVDSNTKATASYLGLDYKAPVKKEAEITKWNTAEIFMKPLPAGCFVQFLYATDKGEVVFATVADGQALFTGEGKKKAVFRIGAAAEIFQPIVLIVPSGNETPEVYRVRTFFT